jgi:hypothetical protein
VCEEIGAFVRSLGWHVVDIVPSPIAGSDGNREFLLGAGFVSGPADTDHELRNRGTAA